jgi:CxC2 like cysteine cluster associated with KDZ transposases
MDYVNRIDILLEALLSRETIEDHDKQCQHCDKGVWAVWRCKDCSLGTPMCRRCIRTSHRNNPFHRIERWNGSFFRQANLWEVGAYLLVRHHVGNPLCDTLSRQIDFLESIETKRDIAEQEIILSQKINSAPMPAPVAAPITATPAPQNVLHSIPTYDEIEQSDQDFIKYLQDLHEQGPDIDPPDILEFDDDEEDEVKEPLINPYLPNETPSDGNGPHFTASIPIGTYLRVVHSNGIHNIAMINCECQGHDMVACDLMASHLLPSSFDRIRTLFTVQLLDLFRLSNLELKASAYHFYHMLRRITAPMDPAGVVDLYREFRRMSRIWRWMKRLKWAGYPGNNRQVKDVEAGELAVFCAACPQPGINIPENWKEDKAREVIFLTFPMYIITNFIKLTGGFTSVFSWPMETSRPIMSGRRILLEMCGSRRDVE